MRHSIHKIICWYLRHCCGAFHCYDYGDSGRYVVLMDEPQYARYAKYARNSVSVRPITPEDVKKEADRNYDLGRKHGREEMTP